MGATTCRPLGRKQFNVKLTCPESFLYNECIMHVPDSRKEQTARLYFHPFVDLFKEYGKSNILDIGCGQGFFLRMLSEAGVNSTGIEVDEKLCRGAREQGLSNVVSTNIFEYLRTTTNRFDGCFASHIVEHFGPDQVRELFTLIHKILEPKGLLVVITPNVANLRRAAGDFWRDPSHVRPYPVSALDKLLSQTGWGVASSGYLTDRPPSVRRAIAYSIRNILFGKFWTPDDLFVAALRE